MNPYTFAGSEPIAEMASRSKKYREQFVRSVSFCWGAVLLVVAGACDPPPNAYGPLRHLADSLAEGQRWSCLSGGVECIAPLGDGRVYFFANGESRVEEVTREWNRRVTDAGADFAERRRLLVGLHGVPLECPAQLGGHVTRDERWWLPDSTTVVMQIVTLGYQEDPAHPLAYLEQHVVEGQRTCAWTPRPMPAFE